MNTQISAPEALAGVFAALSDPHRLAIFERLAAEGEKTVGELAEPFAISGPAISRHIAVLETAGLIERRVERQWRVCRVREEALAAVEDWVTRQRRFWNASFDRLARHLENQHREKNDGSPRKR
jgi:DNA-binding transcriptional ArsR family regulator